MLLLKVACPSGLADDVVKVILANPGMGRITHAKAAEAAEELDIIQTESPEAIVDDVMTQLAAIGDWGDGDITVTQVGTTERYRFARGQAIPMAESDESIGVHQVRRMLRRLVRVDYHYVILMVMAAVIASIGLLADLPIAMVGAMAFSPDLGLLNAMGFAVLIGDGRVMVHGMRSLGFGMLLTIVTAAICTRLLVAISVVEGDPISAIGDRLRDFVSGIDGATITVALAAGAAAMVVFVAERGTAAVGVGVSITTIPAAAYIGIALSDGAWSEVWNGATVLIVNIICVVGAEVLTGIALRNHLNLTIARAEDSRSA